MGSRTDAEILAWQKHAGLVPPTGRQAEQLRRLQKLAFELIKICELEISGIRDGNGYWYGSDPVGGMIHEIGNFDRQLPEPEPVEHVPGVMTF